MLSVNDGLWHQDQEESPILGLCEGFEIASVIPEEKDTY